MTIEEFSNEIRKQIGWMVESTDSHPELTGDKEKDRETVLDDLSRMHGGDIYEVHVDFHLTNGEIVKTRNHCVGSYLHREYVGDNFFMSDGWLYVEYHTGDGIYHQSRIKPESVCWIDAYNVDIDWRREKRHILHKLGLD